MNIAGALALTGLALLLVAAVVGTHAGTTAWRTRDKETTIAWSTFALSVVFFVAGIWTEVLL